MFSHLFSIFHSPSISKQSSQWSKPRGHKHIRFMITSWVSRFTVWAQDTHTKYGFTIHTQDIRYDAQYWFTIRHGCYDTSLFDKTFSNCNLHLHFEFVFPFCFCIVLFYPILLCFVVFCLVLLLFPFFDLLFVPVLC